MVTCTWTPDCAAATSPLDFFDTFTQMVQGLRQMESRQLEDVEAAIKALEGGSREETAAALGRVRDAMNQALERRP